MITPASIGLPSHFTSFRSDVGQARIIMSLIQSDKRINVLQAPPGSGKTVIAIAAALGLEGRALYLTKTKALQNQLYNDMNTVKGGMSLINGHSHYECASMSCGGAGDDDLDFYCSDRPSCRYQAKVNEAKLKDIDLSNYAHWFQCHKSGDDNRLGSFDLLICDEAHGLVSILSEMASISIKRSVFERLLDIRLPALNTPSDSWAGWARHALPVVSRILDGNGQSSFSTRDIAKIKSAHALLTRILDEAPYAEWVTYSLPYSSGFDLRPANISRYVEPFLFRGIKRILLISGTIFPEDVTLLDLAPDDVSFLPVSSPFDPRNRPVIYYPSTPAVRVDRNMSDGDERIWVNRIDTILNFERGVKGIIQARSYDRSNVIAALSRHKTTIMTYDRESAAEMIENFKQYSAPCCLVGPTLEEGVDLPYDLCEYVIWAKVPFLNMSDPFSKAMQARDKHYSNREVARSIIQGSLRGVRSGTDRCRVWMIDKHWSHFRMQPYFFDWFKRGFRQIDSLSKVPRWPAE